MTEIILATAKRSQPHFNYRFRKIVIPGGWFYEVETGKQKDAGFILNILEIKYRLHFNRLVLRGLVSEDSIHGDYRSLWECNDYKKMLDYCNFEGLEVGLWIEG